MASATNLHVTNQYVKYSGSTGQGTPDQDIGIIEVGTNLEAKTARYNLAYIDNPTTTWAKNTKFTVAGYPYAVHKKENVIQQYAMDGNGRRIESKSRDGIQFWTLVNTKIDVSEG